MSYFSSEIVLESQKGRKWSSLKSEQLRLRHVNQISCFNLNCNDLKVSKFYFTLHLTNMSAPFHTSDKARGPHPKWQDLVFTEHPSIEALVLRIWQHKENNCEDTVLITWGVHLSGMFYVGNKVTDIQPYLFKHNTLLFNMFGGFFTSITSVREDLQIQRCPSSLKENLSNLDYLRNSRSVFKAVSTNSFSKNELRRSYNSEKLRKLHRLDVSIKNKNLDVAQIQDRTAELDVLSENRSQPNNAASPPKNPSQLLTMNSLCKMMEEKPTKTQKREIHSMNKKLEDARFTCKLLRQEYERKLLQLKKLRKNHVVLKESNRERESELMKIYDLPLETEKLKQYNQLLSRHSELLIHTNSQLQHRKRQLLQQLLWIYPIKQVSPNKFTINGMFLPNADVLSDATDDSISVALGYVSHILTMCSIFLQVPLRYPINHYGSRSTITDHISANLPEREFPLFTKGKDRMQFMYGVYLLNKNISQLRWLYFMHTPDLKLTLLNLLNFLQGYKESKQDCFYVSSNNLNRSSSGTNNNSHNLIHHREERNLTDLSICGKQEASNDPILDYLMHEKKRGNEEQDRPSGSRDLEKGKTEKSGGGENYSSSFSEILAIPEAFLSNQMNSNSFKNYLSVSRKATASKEDSIKSSSEDIEQIIINCDNSSTNKSLNDKKSIVERSDSVEKGTDILLNTSNSATKQVTEENVKECGESLSTDEKSNNVVVSEENRELVEKFDEIVHSKESSSDEAALQSIGSPLQARTDALLTTKSFNLIKPK